MRAFDRCLGLSALGLKRSPLFQKAHWLALVKRLRSDFDVSVSAEVTERAQSNETTAPMRLLAAIPVMDITDSPADPSLQDAAKITISLLD